MIAQLLTEERRIVGQARVRVESGSHLLPELCLFSECKDVLLSATAMPQKIAVCVIRWQYWVRT